MGNGSARCTRSLWLRMPRHGACVVACMGVGLVGNLAMRMHMPSRVGWSRARPCRRPSTPAGGSHVSVKLPLAVPHVPPPGKRA